MFLRFPVSCILSKSFLTISRRQADLILQYVSLCLLWCSLLTHLDLMFLWHYCPYPTDWNVINTHCRLSASVLILHHHDTDQAFYRRPDSSFHLSDSVCYLKTLWIYGYERAKKHPKSTKFGRQNPIAERWNSEEQLVEWRKAWADVTNCYL